MFMKCVYVLTALIILSYIEKSTSYNECNKAVIFPVERLIKTIHLGYIPDKEESVIIAVAALQRGSQYYLKKDVIEYCCKRIWNDSVSYKCSNMADRLFTCMQDKAYPLLDRVAKLEQYLEPAIMVRCLRLLGSTLLPRDTYPHKDFVKAPLSTIRYPKAAHSKFHEYHGLSKRLLKRRNEYLTLDQSIGPIQSVSHTKRSVSNVHPKIFSQSIYTHQGFPLQIDYHPSKVPTDVLPSNVLLPTSSNPQFRESELYSSDSSLPDFPLHGLPIPEFSSPDFSFSEFLAPYMDISQTSFQNFPYIETGGSISNKPVEKTQTSTTRRDVP